MALLAFSSWAMAQEVADRFNRSNSSNVGNGWSETETGNDGASINGNQLRLQRTKNGNNRQYVTKATPGTYSTTLGQNGCILTWAFSFRQSRSQSALSGFDPGDNGMAMVLAASTDDLTQGQGYAVVLGQSGNTDQLRLVHYNGGLDADANLTDIIAAGDFDMHYLDVRVTFDPSTGTWSLYYRDNGTGGSFGNPLSASTLAGTAVNSTYTGASLPYIGSLWNHTTNDNESAVFDNFLVPSGPPGAVTVTPASPSACAGGSVALTASAANPATRRVTFSSTGGPSTLGTGGAHNGSMYPWNINVSGLPASGVTVESVTLDGVTHTYPDDLDILLQSPSGTNVILMSDVGGSGDIIGSTYTLMDGETAMSDNGQNPSGLYRPTNSGTPDAWPTAPGPGNNFSQSSPSLSLFTGDFNGAWKLLIRDDGSGDGGEVGGWSVTFTYDAAVDYAWSPATGLNTTTGPSVTASPAASQTYTVTASHAANACTSQATPTVTIVDPPSAATTGGAQTICTHGTTSALGGNAPAVGTGSWSVVSGGTGTFSNANDPDATFTHTGGSGPIVLRWTISNAPCTVTTADLTVTLETAPLAAAGAITGPVTACAGETGVAYSVAPMGGAIDYAWTVPAGWTIESGQGTNAIAVTVGAGTGDITVVASNHCGGSNPSDPFTLAIVPDAATHHTGYTTTSTKNSDGITCNSNARRGYLRFPLDGLPDGAVVTAANLQLTHTSSPTPSGANNDITALGNTDPVSTGASALYNAIGSGASYSTAVWPNTGVVSLNLNAAGVAGIQGRIPGWVAMGLKRGGTADYNFHGYSGGANAPRLTLTYTKPRALTVTGTQAPTTASTGGDQTLCPGGTSAGLGGNTPAVGTGAWSVVSGGTGTFSDANDPDATFTHTGGSGPIVLRWTISNAPCTASTADLAITLGCTYYSRATGDVDDPIWSTTPNGTAGPATFTPAISMVVQGGHTVTGSGAIDVRDVTVDNGGTLALDGTCAFTVNGTAATVSGTLTAADNSALAFAGSGAKALSLASPTGFWDLTVDAPDGLTVTGTVRIRGTLLLQDGDFDCTGNPVTLRSTAAFTGRLGPVGATASYTGNLRVERYIPAGATNWRLLGSPIQGRRVADWQDDFFTAGYPGSHYPNFFDPPGSGIFWPSIRRYDEADPGAAMEDGLVGVSSQNQSLVPGQGFAAWCGDNLGGTSAFTIDLEGGAPVIAAAPIALPMSYTSTGNPAADGWNLVANPLPSPIAFEQISRGADVEDYVTYYDPATGNMATWDLSLNAGTNGGTPIIQSMQGFFLKATGQALTTTVSESAKVAGNSGGFFGGSQQSPDLVRLRISSAMNSFSDETVVVFSTGQPGFGSEDVPKFGFGHVQAPRIGTVDDDVLLAINAYGPFTTAISIPVMVHAPVTGTYTLTATGIEQAGLTCLRLEDLVDGTVTTLEEGTAYAFSATAGADEDSPRFMIHATAPLSLITTDALCLGQANGAAEVAIPEGTADVTFYNDMGQPILDAPAAAGTVSVADLPMGDYSVTVEGYEGCGSLTAHFRIEQPTALAADAEGADASCPDSPDGSISLSITGGTAPYTAAWSDGAMGLERPAAAGTFTAEVADAHGCTTVAVATVGSGAAPEAAADAQSLHVAVGEPVIFINGTAGATSYAWDFGDGATSEETAPEHAYADPGTYDVVLTASNGTCTSTAAITVTVELSTGVADAAAQAPMRAWMNGDLLVVEHGFSSRLPLTLEVINEAGQVWLEHRVAGQAGRMTVPAGDLASSIWYVRVSNAETSRTVPVVVVR